jgi:RND family efflux transporter MFP subunit
MAAVLVSRPICLINKKFTGGNFSPPGFAFTNSETIMTKELYGNPDLSDGAAMPTDREVVPVAPGAANLAERPSTKKRSRWVWVVPLVLASGLGVGVVSLINSNRANGGSNLSVNVLPVQTKRVEAVSSYTVNRTYTGTIAAQRSSELGFERAGQLINVAVEEGDRVTAGRVIATLDTRTLTAERRRLQAQRAQAVAQLKELQVGPRAEDIAGAQASVRDLQQQLELSRIKRMRRESLFNEGAISREQLDESAFAAGSLEGRLGTAQSRLDELQAGTRNEQLEAQRAVVEQLEAQIASLDIELSKSILRVPFTGRVALRRLDEGAVVSPGQAIVRLVEDSLLEVRVGVPAKSATRLQIGSSKTIRIGTQTYPATVVSLLPELDTATRTMTVLLHIKADTTIAPNQTVRLELPETIRATGYWLPTTALIPGARGLWSAYVLTTDATGEANSLTVERRDMEVLYTEGDRVLVRGAIAPGDAVITSGSHRIVPGQPVRPTEG